MPLPGGRGALDAGVATVAGADAVGPGVELAQRGGLEARGGLLVEWAEALGQLPCKNGDFAFDAALNSAFNALDLPLFLPLFSPLFDGFSQHGFVLQQGAEVGQFDAQGVPWAEHAVKPHDERPAQRALLGLAEPV